MGQWNKGNYITGTKALFLFKTLKLIIILLTCAVAWFSHEFKDL